MAGLDAIYYLYGPEGYLVDERLAKIRSEAVSPGFESMNYQVFYRDAMDAAEVLSACETLPAFSHKRLVVVKGAESLTARQAEAFCPYISDPSPTTCLVFVSASDKVDLRTNFMKLLKARGCIHEFRRMGDAGLVGWVGKEAGLLGKRITPEAARKLVETAGPRLGDLKGELTKLVLFIGEKELIEGTDVEDSGIDLREETVFKLTDSIAAKDVRAALRVLEKLSGEEPLRILGAIARQIRIMLKLKAATGGRGPAAPKQRLASIAGVPPFAVDKYLKGSSRFTEAELKGAIRRFSHVDMEFKSSSFPKGVVLSRLIMELCSKAPRA